MQKYKSNLTSVSGAAVRGASITVLDESGAIASIFLDRSGALPAGNPLKTAQDGTFEFYAANGRYSLRTDSSGLNVLEEDVILMFDPDDATASGPIADAINEAKDAADRAQESADDAQSAADRAQQLVVNTVSTFDTYAQAVSKLDSVQDGMLVEISQDENNNGNRTRYRLSGGSLVFISNLDQLRLDLGNPEIGPRLISYQQGTEGTPVDLQKILDNFVSPLNFGGYFDGVGDDTEALRKVHAHANLTGRPVSYLGIKTVRAQANARIPINTDVNFNKATFTLLNGVAVVTGWSDDFNVLFHVVDPDCALVDLDLSSLVTADDFKEGSDSFFRNLPDGYVASLFPDYPTPWRGDDGIRGLYMQFGLLAGASNYPLPISLVTYASTVTAKHRKNSRTRIRLSGLLVDMNEPNKQTLLKISRNGVTLDVEWFKGFVERNSCCALVHIDHAADVVIERLAGPGMDRINTNFIATYELYGYGGAQVEVDNMLSSKGWAHMGMSYIGGLTMRNSKVWRFDGHEFVFAVTGENLQLNNSIQYGFCGGDWIFNNIKFILEAGVGTIAMLKPRSDYGKGFIGSIYGKKWSISCNDDTFLSIVDFLDMGASSTMVSMPRKIIIDGIEINLNLSTLTTPRTIRLFDMTKVAGKSCRAPEVVDLNNIVVSSRRAVPIRMYQNPAYFNLPVYGGQTLIRVSKLTSNYRTILTLTGLGTYIGSTSAAATSLNFSDFSEVYISGDWADRSVVKYKSSNVNYENRFTLTNVWPVRFYIDRSIIDYSSGNGLFGPTSGYRAYKNTLMESEIIGNPNLSFFNIMQGNICRKYADDGTTVIESSPVLPTGCTRQDIFDGWKSEVAY